MNSTLEDIVKRSTNPSAVRILSEYVLREVDEKPTVQVISKGQKATGVNLKDIFMPMLAFSPVVFEYIKNQMRKLGKIIDEDTYQTEDGVYVLLSNKGENQYLDDNYVLKVSANGILNQHVSYQEP